jgi:ribose/xylose/arabinose/galactoside ABC-type transport system permease subunit
LYGRYANVWGVFLGAINLVMVRSLMSVVGLDFFLQTLLVGAILVVNVGWMYLYHGIVGLIHRASSSRKADAATARPPADITS